MLLGIVRESNVKAYTKKLRHDGYLIANIYGPGCEEGIQAAFKMGEFIKVVKAKTTVNFDVEVGGKSYNVVVQEYQKHSVSNKLLHVDLMATKKGVINKFKVPVKPVGTPIGLKNKGMLFVNKKRLEVKCAVENLPTDFTFNVDNLDVGNAVLIRDLDFPAGVEPTLLTHVSILSVIKAK